MIGITPDNSSGEMFYIICDTYGQIYSTTTSITIEPTQYKLKAHHYNIEAEEQTAAASSATTTTAESDTEILSEEPPSRDKTYYASDATSIQNSSFLYKLPYDLPLEEPVSYPSAAPSDFLPSG